MTPAPEDHPTPDQVGGGPEHELLAMLHRAGLPVEPELGDEDRVRTDEEARRALDAIVASPRADRTTSVSEALRATDATRADRARRGARLLGPLATAAAAALVVAMVVHPWQDDHQASAGRRSTTPAMADFSLVSFSTGADSLGGEPAAAALAGLARAAEAHAPAGSGPVQHVRLNGWFLDEQASRTTTLVATVTDRYFLPDGSLRSLERRGQPLDDAGRVDDPDPVGVVRTDETEPGPPVGPSYAQHLPTDPAALVTALVPDRTECPVLATCLTESILQLGYTWVLTPDLEAALWRTLEGRAGVTYLGDTRDRLGRPAVGFAVAARDAARQTVLYADPATGALLGSEEVLLRVGPAQEGLVSTTPAVVSFTALADSARVSRADLP